MKTNIHQLIPSTVGQSQESRLNSTRGTHLKQSQEVGFDRESSQGRSALFVILQKEHLDSKRTWKHLGHFLISLIQSR